MIAVHFGAGNIGRGFVGQILHENDAEIVFVDVNETIINDLKKRQKYKIKIAELDTEISIDGVTGINNHLEPEKVIQMIGQADIITTAIGPKVLPYIAEIVAEGIRVRKENNAQPIDIIACENMMGGSDFFKKEIEKYITQEECEYIEKNVGFPNAAVDRIVPQQSHEDSLYVIVENYREWLIDEDMMKQKKIILNGVQYVSNLEPYIERKLFTVNTGHATVAYEGAKKGYKNILESVSDYEIEQQLRAVLAETSQLMIAKWEFKLDSHQEYIEKIIKRFKNPELIDDISRVARTPIRKLGYDERFIKPLRELKDYQILTPALLQTIGKVFLYQDSNDEEARLLQKKLDEDGISKTIEQVTQIKDQSLRQDIESVFRSLKNQELEG